MTADHQKLDNRNPGRQRADLSEPLKTWCGSPTPYPRDKSVPALFEEVAAAHPDKVALVFQNRRLTYCELNAQANRIARQLKGTGIGSESLVGCCIERSIDYIVAILGVLKAGAAYVPLDPTYPKDRLDFLLEDTRTPVIITQTHLVSGVLSGRPVRLLVIDDTHAASSPGEDANLGPAPGPTNLAYVMYTSGSTGRPKGVMVEHRSIVRLV